MDAESDDGALAGVLREEEVEVVADEGVGDALTERVDADLRTGDLRVTGKEGRDDLEEEVVDKFDVVPVGVQKRNLHACCVVFDVVGGGKGTEEDVLDESQTVLKRAVGTQQVSVTFAECHQLSNCVKAHVHLPLKPVVFHVQLRTAYSDLLPQ